MNATIVPALLGADPLHLGQAVLAAERAGAELLHLDVMDGCFVPAISFGTRTVRAVARHTGLPLDVHLQVCDPRPYLDELIDIGVRGVSVHVESTSQLAALLRTLETAGVSRGVVLNPGTPLSAVHELLPLVDQITLMTSSPGTSDYLDFLVHKVERLRRLLEQEGAERIRVTVDGGVTAARVRALARAGADHLVAASAVFAAAGGPEAGLAALRAETVG
ncbi:ribulose-phosphate 3-epimerase [Embleya sp. AB8]|uniref:ribulose-phosphate 3-epimerase n=1 Tax=Embleya sp. AB8 TaxID=3156304 RepID=UPI003C781B7B